MTILQIVAAVLVLPVSSLLLGTWVLRDARRITERAHARERAREAGRQA